MPAPSVTSPADPKPSNRRWVEPVTAVLMGLATLCTAWCSYQSAAFTRRANRLMNESNALERRAGLLAVQGMQTASIHVALFTQVLAAHHAGNQQLADFYVTRLPPDARKAYDAWWSSKPFDNPEAPPHPFVRELYTLRGSDEAEAAQDRAAANLTASQRAGGVSGQYLSNTVLFATVLFFASASGKFEQRRVRFGAFAFAVIIFLFALIRTGLLPL